MPKNESPPVKIANGLGTKAGLGGAVALLVPVLMDFLSTDTIANETRNLLIVCATVLAAVVVFSRGLQAVAAEFKRGGERLALAPGLLVFASHGGGHSGETGAVIELLFVLVTVAAFIVAIWLCTRSMWIPALVAAFIGVLLLIYAI